MSSLKSSSLNSVTVSMSGVGLKDKDEQDINNFEMNEENANDNDILEANDGGAEDINNKRRGRPSGTSHILQPVKKATIIRTKGKYIRNSTKTVEGMISKINASKILAGSATTADAMAITEAKNCILISRL